MSNATRARTKSVGMNFSYVVHILAAIMLLCGLHAAVPASADETGIRGKVLRGPVRGGPVTLGQSHEAPFRASFSVLDPDRKVTRFESDEKGCFEVLLPPGEYVIVPDKSAPILFPQRQGKEVTVPEDGFARVTLKFDTGMR